MFFTPIYFSIIAFHAISSVAAPAGRSKRLHGSHRPKLEYPELHYRQRADILASPAQAARDPRTWVPALPSWASPPPEPVMILPIQTPPRREKGAVPTSLARKAMKAAGQVLEDMADKAAIPPEKRQEALKFAASAYNWANENFWPYSSYLSFANAVMNFGLVRGFIHPLVTRRDLTTSDEIGY